MPQSGNEDARLKTTSVNGAENTDDVQPSQTRVANDLGDSSTKVDVFPTTSQASETVESSHSEDSTILHGQSDASPSAFGNRVNDQTAATERLSLSPDQFSKDEARTTASGLSPLLSSALPDTSAGATEPVQETYGPHLWTTETYHESGTEWTTGEENDFQESGFTVQDSDYRSATPGLITTSGVLSSSEENNSIWTGILVFDVTSGIIEVASTPSFEVLESSSNFQPVEESPATSVIAGLGVSSDTFTASSVPGGISSSSVWSNRVVAGPDSSEFLEPSSAVQIVPGESSTPDLPTGGPSTGDGFTISSESSSSIFASSTADAVPVSSEVPTTTEAMSTTDNTTPSPRAWSTCETGKTGPECGTSSIAYPL